MGMFSLKKNNIKTLAFGLKKEGGKYLRTKNNFGNRVIQDFKKKVIQKIKYNEPLIILTEGKKNIYTGSTEQMSRQRLRSLLNMVSKSKPFVPLIFASGSLYRLTEFRAMGDLVFPDEFLNGDDVTSTEGTETSSPLGTIDEKLIYEKVIVDDLQVDDGKENLTQSEFISELVVIPSDNKEKIDTTESLDNSTTKKKIPKCSVCKQEGHNKRTCNQIKVSAVNLTNESNSGEHFEDMFDNLASNIGAPEKEATKKLSKNVKITKKPFKENKQDKAKIKALEMKDKKFNEYKLRQKAIIAKLQMDDGNEDIFQEGYINDSDMISQENDEKLKSGCTIDETSHGDKASEDKQQVDNENKDISPEDYLSSVDIVSPVNKETVDNLQIIGQKFSRDKDVIEKLQIANIESKIEWREKNKKKDYLQIHTNYVRKTKKIIGILDKIEKDFIYYVIKLTPTEEIIYNKLREDFLESSVLEYFWEYEKKIKRFVQKARKKISKDSTKTYTFFFDGACKGNPGHSSAGFLLQNDAGSNLGEFYSYLGPSFTNNQAEYAGITIGQLISRMVGIKNLKIYGDSKLIINQMNGRWNVNDIKMKETNADAKRILCHFDKVLMEYVPRRNNSVADDLANKAIEEVVGMSEDYYRQEIWN